MVKDIVIQKKRWVRSQDGWIAGVCGGLAHRFGIEPWIIRLLWAGAFLVYGAGALLYLILALTFPREDRTGSVDERKLLGVCYRLSQRTGIEVGPLRALTILAGLVSLGTVLILYVVLHFVLPANSDTYVTG